MTKSFDVCIWGDGVVGRTLALQLAQARLRVALVSRPDSPPLVSDVRAYALNGASQRQLQSLRAWPDLQHATPVRAMEVWGDDGGYIDFQAHQQGDAPARDALAWIVDVPALEDQLAQAIRYQPQIETLAADTATAQPVKASLRVICEGQYSAGRASLPVQHDVKSYGQRAIAARLESTLPHHGSARQWFTGGEILALLPIGGEKAHGLALVWSVSDERAAALQQMPDAEFCAALQSVCGSVGGSFRLTSERACWPLTLSSAQRWVGSGWALAGDAAHTIHPLAGQGLNLGLADAACLVNVLAGREYWRELGDERLLRRYERARKSNVVAMGAVTDGLHSLFGYDDALLSGPLQALRNWGMNSVAMSNPLKRWVAKRAAGI